ncbi:hypothetical protein [Nocardia xishanensis]|uniref:hypothetical protein n=1 Tax=Nocardia xishanensis TaxID=238964 RepID=UPI0012F4BC5C|nr:hypothetical protein [Nocardia xishanensis]
MHIPLVEGIYPGRTRVYKLDPPLPDPDNGNAHEYVAVVVQPGRRNHQLPETLVFAANPINGGPKGPSMKRLPGSGILYFWPDDPDDGWRWALMQLGVTQIEGAA